MVGLKVSEPGTWWTGGDLNPGLPPLCQSDAKAAITLSQSFPDWSTGPLQGKAQPNYLKRCALFNGFVCHAYDLNRAESPNPQAEHLRFER